MVPLIVLGLLLIDATVAQQARTSAFSCKGRGMGYYADVSTGCQVYHMCDGLGRQFSYTCPNATLFQQRMLICDHWYMVNCSKAEDDYSANLLIGQKEKPFVENADYRRTPRPDLLHTSETEYNIIYRSGNDQTQSTKNVVGAEENKETTEEYFPPSHWSTEFTRTTVTTVRPSSKGTKPPASGAAYYRTSYNSNRKGNTKAKAKAIDLSSSNKNVNVLDDGRPKNDKSPVQTGDSPVNFKSTFKATTPVFPDTVTPDDTVFKSNFKATTPVYPTTVEATSEHPEDLGLLPPIPYQSVKKASGNQDQVQTVNFESRFNATTPNYPLSVDATSPDPGDVGLLPPQVEVLNEKNSKTSQRKSSVNFQSSFKATTPVYPTSVETTSPDPSDVGLLPPQSLEKDFQVNFQSKFKATTPNYPKSVEPTSPDPNDAGLLPPEQKGAIENKQQTGTNVNFQSKFKATTPVYPTSVETTSPDPGEVGLLPPQSKGLSSESDSQPNQFPQAPNPSVPSLSLSFEPPKIDNTFKDRKDTLETVTLPSPAVFYQPPKFDPDYTVNLGSTDPPFGELSRNKPGNFILTMKPEQLKDLRQMFHIPDYDFPLESVSRPGYDGGISSFEAKRVKKR